VPTVAGDVSPATPAEFTVPEAIYAVRQPAGLPEFPGYTLLAQLGRGGMGVVYLARQERPGRLVAVKTVTGDDSDEVVMGRFRRESAVLGQLRHPNIVPVYEVGEHAGRAYFSMEYLEGGGLDRRLAGTPQPPAVAAAVAEVLARAVHAAHQAGVVHRDLKPANVLIAEASGEKPPPLDRCTLKITDFGLAKQIDSGPGGATRTGALLGTPGYMAPEQASGKGSEAGPAADIYSLGAVLYELLTGRPPFRAATMWDTLEQVMKQEPLPPSRLQPGLPRDLETICLKCLAKEPAKRYATAAELADDLRRFLDGKSVTARRPSSAERAVKWARRNPGWAAVVAVAVVSAVAIGALAAVRVKESHDRAEERVKEAQEREAEQTRFASELRTERDQAVNNLVLALRATDDLLAPLDDANLAFVPGMRDTAKVQIAKALPLLDEAGARSQTPAVRLAAAKVFKRIGTIQSELGEHAVAERTLDRAVGLLESPDPRSRPADEVYELSHALYLRALRWKELGRLDAALADSDRIEQLAPFLPASPEAAAELARDRVLRGGLLLALGRYPEARAVLKEAEAAFRRLLAVEQNAHRRGVYESELARALDHRGDVDSKLARMAQVGPRAADAVPLFESAVALGRESLEIRARLAAAPGSRPTERVDYADALQSLAGDLIELAHHRPAAELLREADRCYEKAIGVYEELARDYPSMPRYRYKLGNIRHHHAFGLCSRRRFDAGECNRLLDAAEADLRRAMKDSPTAAAARIELGDLLYTRIVVALKTNDLFGAVRAGRALAAEPGDGDVKPDEWRKGASILALVAWAVLADPDRQADTLWWLAQAWMAEAGELVLRANSGSRDAARKDLQTHLVFLPLRKGDNWPELLNRLVPAGGQAGK
jgi:tetratricopeptide (TPR) repeat protein